MKSFAVVFFFINDRICSLFLWHPPPACNWSDFISRLVVFAAGHVSIARGAPVRYQDLSNRLYPEWSWLVQNCVLRLRFLLIFQLRDLISKNDKLFSSLYSWVWFQPLEAFFLAISWKETRPTPKTAWRRPATMINAVVTNSTSVKPLSSLKRKSAYQSWEKTWGEMMLWEFLVVFIVITFKKTKTINCSAIRWRLRLSVSFVWLCLDWFSPFELFLMLFSW